MKSTAFSWYSVGIKWYFEISYSTNHHFHISYSYTCDKFSCHVRTFVALPVSSVIFVVICSFLCWLVWLFQVCPVSLCIYNPRVSSVLYQSLNVYRCEWSCSLCSWFQFVCKTPLHLDPHLTCDLFCSGIDYNTLHMNIS